MAKPSKESRSTDDLIALGNAFRDARTTAGLTKVELSARSGIHRSTLQRIESGEIDPQYLTMAKIADALGSSVEIVKRPAVGAPELNS
jgi:transcriptional regulator with XRE-family HTH domain